MLDWRSLSSAALVLTIGVLAFLGVQSGRQRDEALKQLRKRQSDVSALTAEVAGLRGELSANGIEPVTPPTPTATAPQRASNPTPEVTTPPATSAPQAPPTTPPTTKPPPTPPTTQPGLVCRATFGVIC